MGIQLVPISMTLNDGARCVEVNEDRPILSAAKGGFFRIQRCTNRP